jgi:hypothetical protein
VEVEDDRQEPRLQVLTAARTGPCLATRNQASWKKVLGLGPVPRQVKNKSEDVGLVPVVNCVEFAAAVHLST